MRLLCWLVLGVGVLWGGLFLRAAARSYGLAAEAIEQRMLDDDALWRSATPPTASWVERSRSA